MTKTWLCVVLLVTNISLIWSEDDRNLLKDFDVSDHLKLLTNTDERKVAPEILSPAECARNCVLNSTRCLPFRCEGFNLCQNPNETTSCEYLSRNVLHITSDELVTDKHCSFFWRLPEPKSEYVTSAQLTRLEDMTTVAGTANQNLSKETQDHSILTGTPDQHVATGTPKYSPWTDAASNSTINISSVSTLTDRTSSIKHTNRQSISTEAESQSLLTQSTAETSSAHLSSEKKFKASGHSSGSMVGVGIGMTTLGFLVGVVAMVIFTRLRRFNRPFVGYQRY